MNKQAFRFEWCSASLMYQTKVIVIYLLPSKPHNTGSIYALLYLANNPKKSRFLSL